MMHPDMWEAIKKLLHLGMTLICGIFAVKIIKTIMSYI